MTERKLTDEEVISELQSASEWFTEHGKNTNTAIIGICNRAVDLINRKNAEINILIRKHNTLLDEIADKQAEIERAQQEIYDLEKELLICNSKDECRRITNNYGGA